MLSLGDERNSWVVQVPVRADAFNNEAVASMWRPHLPLNRLGTVEQVANATIPLLTNEWITGAIWAIDGGMTARGNIPIYPNRPRPPARGQRVPIFDDAILDDLLPIGDDAIFDDFDRPFDDLGRPFGDLGRPLSDDENENDFFPDRSSFSKK